MRYRIVNFVINIYRIIINISYIFVSSFNYVLLSTFFTSFSYISKNFYGRFTKFLYLIFLKQNWNTKFLTFYGWTNINHERKHLSRAIASSLKHTTAVSLLLSRNYLHYHTPRDAASPGCVFSAHTHHRSVKRPVTAIISNGNIFQGIKPPLTPRVRGCQALLPPLISPSTHSLSLSLSHTHFPLCPARFPAFSRIRPRRACKLAAFVATRSTGR